MKNKLLTIIALLGGLTTGQAQAAAILYWADWVVGSDSMAAALSASSHTVTTASDESNFVTQVSAGGWDLVVFMNQNWSNPSAQDAIQSWANGGGKAIFADWTKNATSGSAFDASYTAGYNLTSFNISDALLAAGITNPVSLVNSGWGIFSMDMLAGVGGNVVASFVGGNAAIVIGNGGNTIINGFLSDTFTNFDTGVQLYTNEINLVLGSTVPEPASLALMGLGLVGLAAARRRKSA